jgi:hypothetical protein
MRLTGTELGECRRGYAACKSGLPLTTSSYDLSLLQISVCSEFQSSFRCFCFLWFQSCLLYVLRSLSWGFASGAGRVGCDEKWKVSYKSGIQSKRFTLLKDSVQKVQFVVSLPE